METVMVDVRKRPDGRIEIDFQPPTGPFITITPAQWKDLLTVIRERKGQP